MVSLKPKKSTAALLVFATIITAAPAAEAAHFNANFSGVRNGFKTRTWYDGGGSSQTTVHTSRCTADHGKPNLALTLWREIRFLPDHNLGTRNASGCVRGTAYNAWWGIGTGNYYLTIGGLFDWQRASGNINVTY